MAHDAVMTPDYAIYIYMFLQLTAMVFSQTIRIGLQTYIRFCMGVCELVRGF